MNLNSDQILLPFAEREYVDVNRTARILGVSATTVLRLAATRDPSGQFLLNLIDFRRGARKRILYSSIVRFCDRIRAKFGIPDRRPPLSNPIFRHKDDDLLPFPISDTIGIKAVLPPLGFVDKRPVVNLIEEGAFEAYQIYNETPWRISRTSFLAFMEKTRTGGSSTGVPYPASTEERQLTVSGRN